MNKKIGTEFEKKVCKILAGKGYWVHFIAPDVRGSQPFDIIAAKKGMAFAIDCKTCVSTRFNISRLEENQIAAFEKWLKCGNSEPLIIIEHHKEIVLVEYSKLKNERTVKVDELQKFVP
jgi:Holliday junction resolvase